MHMELKKVTVHHILVISYLVHFFGFLTGVLLDSLFPNIILKYEVFGIVCILLATVIIIWAQFTTGSTKQLRKEGEDESIFAKGPYVFTRTPTHLGLALLLIGAGALFGGLYIIITAIISFGISNLFLLPKEEKMLEEKYGDAYKKYKENVRQVVGKK